MGPQNGIMGNDSFGTDLPKTELPEDAMTEVINTAKFSKTKEFLELKQYLESRMDFYKVYLPSGEPIIGKQNMTEVGSMWMAANVIIGELKAIIDVYEQAAQAVKDANKK